MNKLIRNILQLILQGTIAFVLMCIDGEIVYRWEFWMIFGLIILIRLVDAAYEADK